MKSVVSIVVAVVAVGAGIAPARADAPRSGAASEAEAAIAPAPEPTSTLPEGWAELDLDLDVRGAAVELDSGHFCGMPCRMLVTPGEHTFTISGPGLDPVTYTRTFESGSALRLEGGFVDDSIDGWGVALYVLGAAAILTATGLVAWDVAMNVGYAQDDWTKSYVSAGIGPLGLLLAIWGAVWQSPEETEPTETILRLAP